MVRSSCEASVTSWIWDKISLACSRSALERARCLWNSALSSRVRWNARFARSASAVCRCMSFQSRARIPSVGQIEERSAIGATALQAGEVAAIAYIPAVVEPNVVDARDENAAAMRSAGSPAGIRDSDRGREAQALRRAAVQLRVRRDRLLKIPTLARARERGKGECQHQCESENTSHARSPQNRMRLKRASPPGASAPATIRVNETPSERPRRAYHLDPR